MPNKFNPMKARLRASFAAALTEEPRLENIDKEGEVLHGVQITLEGEAKGHGVWLDREFCEAVAAAGNAMGDAGVKVRFGHPAMCSDALGTYLGRAKNFRVVDLTRKGASEGDAKTAGVLADIHIAPESHSAPSGDLGKWVMEAAENSPDTFGQSIVFTYADFVVKDAEGTRHSYNEECCNEDESKNKTSKQWKSQSADGKEYAVLGKLLGTDFTDTPAATDGVFSAGDLAAEAEEMLAEHPEILSAIEGKPEKVIEFLARNGMLDYIQTAALDAMKAECDKRIAGFQSMHDKKMAEFEGQVKELTSELEAAKAAASAEHESLGKVQGELDALRGEHAATVERLKAAENAHRKLTGGALTVGESVATGPKTFAAFVREHGNDFSRAVREDPETYKRLCEASGCSPEALKYI